jgi:hypothetical protein
MPSQPDNAVLVGGIKGSTVKLIDFGLSYRTANMQVRHPSKQNPFKVNRPCSSNMLPFPSNLSPKTWPLLSMPGPEKP